MNNKDKIYSDLFKLQGLVSNQIYKKIMPTKRFNETVLLVIERMLKELKQEVNNEK